MTTPITPICLFCRHFNRDDEEAFSCRAYPQGIPEAIVISESDHRQPYRGDHGMRFEPVDPEGARYADEVFAEVHAS